MLERRNYNLKGVEHNRFAIVEAMKGILPNLDGIEKTLREKGEHVINIDNSKYHVSSCSEGKDVLDKKSYLVNNVGVRLYFCDHTISNHSVSIFGDSENINNNLPLVSRLVGYELEEHSRNDIK